MYTVFTAITKILENFVSKYLKPTPKRKSFHENFSDLQ